MSRWRAAVPLLLVIALGGVFTAALRWVPRELPSPLVELPAPALAAPRLDDAQASFSRDTLRGRVWLLNVWASWCTACLEEHAALLALAERRQTTLIGLNHRDRRDLALAWLQRHGDPYKLSVFDADGQVGRDWGIYGVPTTFVIDAGGTIRFRHVGALTPRVVAEQLEPLLHSLQR